MTPSAGRIIEARNWRYGTRRGRGHDIVALPLPRLTSDDGRTERGTCRANFPPTGEWCNRNIHRQHGGAWRHNPRPYGK